jgi:predicted nucleic acid-binding protein
VSLVLDGSAALAWCFDDESTAPIDAIMLKVANEGAVTPSLWRFEVANGLQTAIRRKRIDVAYRDRMLDNLAALNILIDAESDSYVWSATAQLAAVHGLTVYDAAYLELAQRRRLPLATLDAALARAAGQAGVEVIP